MKFDSFYAEIEEGLTWTQCVAGDLLHRHALAESPSVQRSRVGAGSRALLDAAPTRHVARRPLCPQGPAAVHWREGRKVEEEEEAEVEWVHNNVLFVHKSALNTLTRAAAISDYAGCEALQGNNA